MFTAIQAHSLYKNNQQCGSKAFLSGTAAAIKDIVSPSQSTAAKVGKYALITLVALAAIALTAFGVMGLATAPTGALLVGTILATVIGADILIGLVLKGVNSYVEHKKKTEAKKFFQNLANSISDGKLNQALARKDVQADLKNVKLLLIALRNNLWKGHLPSVTAQNLSEEQTRDLEESAARLQRNLGPAWFTVQLMVSTLKNYVPYLPPVSNDEMRELRHKIHEAERAVTDADAEAERAANEQAGANAAAASQEAA